MGSLQSTTIRPDNANWRSLVGWALLLAVAWATLAIRPVAAATITVTNTNDSGAGSLRQAILTATANDTIVFDAGLAGQTITLSQALNVTQPLIIDASATANVTVSGGGAVRVFNATAPLTLIGFTVNNGKAPTNQLGGGIITNKALTLTAMTISNNQASSGGGVYLDSGGSALITDSTLKGNSAVNAGGALFDQGDSVTIQRSSIYSNTAADGGGILVDSGTLLVVNSTVSGNQATGSTPSGRGGGVWVAITSATVRYSSMLNNSASNTGGGLFVKAGGDVALDSTVIAASPTGGDCIGTVSGPGHNFIEDGVNTCGLTFGVNNNIVGQSPSGLAPLGDYGGPTWTHAGYYSGNIPDHGNPATCPAVDQRGFARPRGSACDMGAVESDTTPFVQQVTPGHLATNVLLDSNIVFTYNEPVSAPANAIGLQCPAGTPVAINVTLAGDNRTLTLDPVNNLPTTTTCRWSIDSTLVTDLDSDDPPDNSFVLDYGDFTTGATTSDAAPTVSTVNPNDGATGVVASANLVFQFSEAVTAPNAAFSLQCPTNTAVTFAVTGSGSNSVTIDPTSDLPAGVTCTWAITGSQITDVDTNDPPDSLTSSPSGSFTTAAPAVAYDYGDAPDPAFPTLNTNNGARHQLSSSLRLGAAVDAEGDGQPNGSASGDDSNGDDEDGVSFPTERFACADITVTVTPSAPGVLNAWLDFNGDGDWNDFNEQIAHSLAVKAGAQSLPLAIPCNVTLNTALAARFRLSTVAVLGYNGDAPDGEVEDYTINFAVGAPLAINDYASMGEDTAILIDVLANDSDPLNGALTITAVSTPAHGTATIEGTAIRFTPGPNFNGVDRFTYTIRNATNKTAQGAVRLGVRSANDAPTDVLLSNDTLTMTLTEGSARTYIIPAGTEVGTLNTVDPDANDLHSYALSGADADKFVVEGNVLRTAKPIEVELPQSLPGTPPVWAANIEQTLALALNVQATDAGKKVAGRNVVIKLLPADPGDPPQYIVPRGGGGARGLAAEIKENLLIDAAVADLLTFYQTSAKWDAYPPYKYELVAGAGADDNQSFRVATLSDNRTWLIAKTAFDYEAKRLYSIRVRMTDGIGQILYQQILVRILDQEPEIPANAPAKCKDSSFKLIDTTSTLLEVTAIQASNVTTTGCDVNAKLNLRLNRQSHSFDVTGKIDAKGQFVLDEPLGEFTLNIAGLSLRAGGAEIEYYQDRPSLRLKDALWCMPNEWGGACVRTQSGSLIIDSTGLRIGGGFKMPFPDLKVGKGLTISGIEAQINPVAGGYELTGAGEFGLPKFQARGANGCSLSASLTIYTDAQGATVVELQAAAVSSPDAVALREVSVGISCDKGIPIDTTGLELTGVSGKLSLRSGEKYVELAVKVESTGKLGSLRLATIDGSAKVLWDPQWGLDMLGTVKLLSYFEMANVSTSVRDNRFSLNGYIRSTWTKGSFNLNAWTDYGGSFTVTGGGKIEFGIGKGAIFNNLSESCSNVGREVCSVVTSWMPWPADDLVETVCHTVVDRVCKWVGIAVPPWDMRLGTIGADFGKFENGNYGIKGYFEVGQILGNVARDLIRQFGVPEQLGAFFDHKGTAAFGSVSKYQLVTPPQFAAALARYQTGQNVQAAGGGMSIASTDAITVISDRQLLIAAPLTPLDAPAVSAAGVISQVRVTEPSTVTFILTSGVTPTLSLIAPDGTTITPANYNQPPISGRYTVQYNQLTVYSPLELVDEADHSAPRLRFVNLSAHASLSAVDVLIDGLPAWRNVTPFDAAILDGSDGMDYIELEPGQHVLRVVPSGQSTTILSTTVYAEPNMGYTLFTSGATTPQLRLLDDKDSVPPSFGQMYTRFVHVGDASRKINVLINGTPIVSNLGYGETSAYQLIPNGSVLLEVKDATSGQALMPASQYTPNGTVVRTVFLFEQNTGAYVMDYISVVDDIYLPQVYTIYNVGHAGVGNWKVDVNGDLSDPNLSLAVISFPKPPSLSNVTVDAVTLSQTKVNWTLRSDYAPTTVRLYANPGELNSTLAYTDSNNLPVNETIVNYAGYLVSEVKVTDLSQLAGAPGSLTADLTKLESGTYRLWLAVDDGVSPAKSAYANRLGSSEIAVITVDNAANFPLTWSPTISTVLDSANTELLIEWTALGHPDVDSYAMYLGSVPGTSERSMTDIAAFYNRDAQGNPVGVARGAGAFGNITPGIYYLTLEAIDEESGRKVRSGEVQVTIGAGDYTLTTAADRYTVAPGATITIPLSLTMAQPLYYPNVPLSINDFGLPSGIFVQFANDLLGDTFLRNSSGTVAFAASGANANVLASDAASDAASGDAQTVNLVVTVDATTVPGSYPITLVGYNGSNEKQHKVTVVVSGNAGTTSQIFLPLINR